jgi:RAB protein geranylgeranyltransferase component A
MTDNSTTAYSRLINVGDIFTTNQNVPSAVSATVRVTSILSKSDGRQYIDFISVGGGRYNRAGTKGRLSDSQFCELFEHYKEPAT